MEYKRLLVFFFVFCLCGPVGADPIKSLVKIDKLSLEKVLEFHAKGLDIPRAGKDFIEVVLTSQQRKVLEKEGFHVKEIVPNLDSYVANRLKAQTRESAYFTYLTLTAKLQEWAGQFQKISKLSSLGKSIEGREIWAFKVSDNPEVDENEPSVLVMGAHHSREWISVEVPMKALKEYLEGYEKDPKITQLVNEREVWFVPMLNPDGVTYSQTKYKYWRKNRRNVDGRNFGVDLNRNYSYKWGLTGASDSPSSDVYHGKGPFSEPETQAIQKLCEKEHFQTSVSFHSYSELILFPFGYDYNVPCSDTPILSKLAGEMAQFNAYTPENSSELYPCMGDSDDYFYGEHKTLAFTFELATEFIPPPSQIEKINKINVPAVFHLIDKAGTYAVNSPTGDPALIANLDLQTALDALKDGEKVLEIIGENNRPIVMDRLTLIERKIANLVTVGIQEGKTDVLRIVESSNGSPGLERLIKQKLVFSKVHEEFNGQDTFVNFQGLH